MSLCPRKKRRPNRPGGREGVIAVHFVGSLVHVSWHANFGFELDVAASHQPRRSCSMSSAIREYVMLITHSPVRPFISLCLLLLTVFGCGDGGGSTTPQVNEAAAPASDTPSENNNSGPQLANTSPTDQASTANVGTPEADIPSSIEEMIELLETGEIKTFVETRLRASDLQKLRRGGQASYDRQLKRLSAPPVIEMLIDELRAVRDSVPHLNEARTTARLQMQFNADASPRSPEELSAELNRTSLIEVSGFGDDLKTVLARAVEVLTDSNSPKDSRLDDFVSSVFPVSELYKPDSGLRTTHWFERIEWSQALVDSMVTDLQALQTLTPQYEDDGNIASFVIPGEVREQSAGTRDPDRLIRFELVDGNWRFFDNTRRAREATADWSKLHPLESDNLKKMMPVIILEKQSDRWMLVGRHDREFPIEVFEAYE